METDLDFDLQLSKFEFSSLPSDLSEIRTEVKDAIDAGQNICKMLTQLGFREIVIEAAQELLN